LAGTVPPSCSTWPRATGRAGLPSRHVPRLPSATSSPMLMGPSHSRIGCSQRPAPSAWPCGPRIATLSCEPTGGHTRPPSMLQLTSNRATRPMATLTIDYNQIRQMLGTVVTDYSNEYVVADYKMSSDVYVLWCKTRQEFYYTSYRGMECFHVISG
jgi:hypothetical protein